MKNHVISLLLTVACVVSYAQDNGYQRNPNDQQTIEVDPIHKLVPGKKAQLDSMAVLTSEEVTVTASKRDIKKAQRQLREQFKVGQLTLEIVKNFKFQFEPYYCRYKTEYRSNGFLGLVQCYGGRFTTSLAVIPMNNQEYRRYHEMANARGGYAAEMAAERSANEKSFTDFDVEDLHFDEDNDLAYFDVVLNSPVIVDGRTEYHLRYNFALNYKNAKMACVITGDARKYASYYGYLNNLR